MPSAVETRRRITASSLRKADRTISAVWTVHGECPLTLVADLSKPHRGKLKLSVDKVVPIGPTFVLRGHASTILIAMDLLEQLRRLQDGYTGIIYASEVWQVMLWCYMDAMDRKEAWHAYHKNDGNWQPNFIEVTLEGLEHRKQYDKLVDWQPVRQGILAELRERKSGWDR